jgi:fatty acid desaturase
MLGPPHMPAARASADAHTQSGDGVRTRKPADFAQAFAELRERITAAGLLKRAYGYYAWRGGLSFVLLSIGVASVLLLPGGPAGMAVSSVLLAFGSVQVALVGHDAGHLAVFKSARWNWLLGWVCWTVVLGIGFWYWYDRHNRHHANTNNLAADPDLQWAGIVAYSEDVLQTRRTRARWLIRQQALLGPLYTLGLAFAFRLESWAFAVRRLRGRRRVCEVVLLTASLVAWLAPAGALGWTWLVTFALGQVLAGLYLALAIAPNHKGMPTWASGEKLSFLEQQVLSSRNILPHPVADFVFGGLNYQIEHHLFPSMPRVHFGRARSVVKPFCLAHGLPYEEMSALASYRLVIAELRRVGRKAATEWV